jgi:hypothetical protein
MRAIGWNLLVGVGLTITGATAGAPNDSATNVPLQLDVPENAIAVVPDNSQYVSDAQAVSGDEGYFENWFARVAEAQDSQPHWMTPIATVTPRLEEEFRYDEYWEHLGNGAALTNSDSGKGLELIPTTTNEVLFNLPPYEDRSNVKAANGWGDWPFLVVKQRLLSSPEDAGNYIVSMFLGVQAPTGSTAFTNHAWIVTPTLAAGKGWGDFDVQGTVGVAIPTSHSDTIGTSVATNISFQYHWAKFFWPEFEVNDTYWSGGERRGKNQIFLTPGLVLGRFDLVGRTRLVIGAGYQFAVAPKQVFVPALTPAYNHSWILTARVGF